MILTVGNTKGGVGKTSIAVNLAIARASRGRDVLLVEGDEQGTAAAFTVLRTEQKGEPGYTAVTLLGASLRTQVRQMSSKYDDIIIDCGGRDTGSFRAALTVTDCLLVPVQPRTFDVWALDQVQALVEEARAINEHLQSYLMLSIADPTGRDNTEAAEALWGTEGFHYLTTAIVRRKAWPNAAARGLSVLEYTPKDPKAIAELNALVDALYG